MRTISCSTSRLIRGLPGLRRPFEPSNLRATSLRYQAKMVSGCAKLAASLRILRPSRWPISPSVARSASERFSRPFNRALEFDFRRQDIRSAPAAPGPPSPLRTAASAPNPFVLHASRFAIDCPKNHSQRHPAKLRREWTTHRLFPRFNSLAIRDSYWIDGYFEETNLAPNTRGRS